MPPHRAPVEDMYLAHGLSVIISKRSSAGGYPLLLAALSRAALDLVLPPLCACCDAAVAAPGQLCGTCFQKLAFISEPSCQRCGIPFGSPEHAGPTRTCTACTDSPPPWRHACAALVYDDAAKSLILPLKHTDRGENAAVLALHMQRAGARLLATADLLVPSPCIAGASCAGATTRLPSSPTPSATAPGSR